MNKKFILIFSIVILMAAQLSYAVSVQCHPSCSESTNHFTFNIIEKVDNCDGTFTYRFKVTNKWWQGLSYVVVGLPYGVVPIDPDDGSTYSGAYNNYDVENPTNNPFYSIKYETIGEGVKNWGFDIFEFTVDEDIGDYPVNMKAKAGSKQGAATINCDIPVSEDCGNDQDNDGYTDDVDCNDNDPDVYPGAYEECNGIDDDCGGKIDEGCCTGYSCVVPDDLNDRAQEDISLGFEPEVDDLQKLLDNYGLSVDVQEDQTNDQVWDVNSGLGTQVKLEVELIGKGGASNSNVFGYMKDSNNFVPLFQIGSHSDYSVPSANSGDKFTFIVDNADQLVFGIDSEDASGSSNLFTTRNSWNPDSEDHAVVYDYCNDEWIVAFEDLLYAGADLDYEDMVVIVRVLDCDYEEQSYEAVKPILECVVDNQDGSYTAHFGYLNENDFSVDIPIGNENKFTPNPQDRGQSVTFEPGRTSYWPNASFTVDFYGGNLVWTLEGPDGNTRTSTASSNSKKCSYHVFLEKEWHDDYGMMEEPPMELQEFFEITAESDIGNATCGYENDTLVCEYNNQEGDNNGLAVPVGTEYYVSESYLPPYWVVTEGKGDFAIEDHCVMGRDGIAKYCTHLIRNDFVYNGGNGGVGVVPEFSDYGLIAALVLMGLATAYIMKKRK